jgi:ATP-dependent DNA helicase RecG
MGAIPGEVTGEATGEDVAKEVKKLVQVLSGQMKRTEIQNILDLKHEDYFREAYLVPAIEAGFIEMTIPDKPQSPNQRYKLTQKGESLKSYLKQKDSHE